MQLKLMVAATSLVLGSPVLAAEPPLHSGVTYVVEADNRDATGTGTLTIRPADERGEPEQDAAPTKVQVRGCDGELGNLARVENGASSGTLRTFLTEKSAARTVAPRALLNSAVMSGQQKASCRIGG